MAAEAQRAPSVRERTSFAADSGASFTPLNGKSAAKTNPAVTSVPADIAERVESLGVTAEYLECLLDVVKDAASDLRQFVATGSCSEQMRGWREIKVLLNLALAQVNVVADVSRAFSKAQVAVAI